MIKILESLTLELQCLHNRDLPRVVFVTCRSGDLDLLYGNHLPSSGIQRQVDATEIALPNEFTPNPFEYGCEDEI